MLLCCNRWTHVTLTSHLDTKAGPLFAPVVAVSRGSYWPIEDGCTVDVHDCIVDNSYVHGKTDQCFVLWIYSEAWALTFKRQRPVLGS